MEPKIESDGCTGYQCCGHCKQMPMLCDCDGLPPQRDHVLVKLPPPKGAQTRRLLLNRWASLVCSHPKGTAKPMGKTMV